MKKLRNALAFFLVLIFGLGGSGCMNGNKLESEILDYLRQKHGDQFRLLALTDENSGYEGHFLRAVCRSESIDTPFVLYLYQSADHGDEKAVIGGQTYGVKDEYPNVRLQQEYARMLQEALPEARFIGCTIETTGRCYTADEVDAGLAACAKISKTRSFVSAYVIIDSAASGEALFHRVEDELSALPFFRQYLYFGRSARGEDYWKTQFAENYDSFDSFFMRSGQAENPVTFKIPDE